MNNDLISREALKKLVNELLDLAVNRVNDTPTNSPCYRMYVEQKNERTRLIDLINSAPTVEPLERIGSICEENCGYRPQGEWIENNYGRIQCSICKGDAISTMTGCLVDRHLEQYKTRFCPWCGADMQKGGAGNDR